MTVLITIAIYFCVILLISRLAGRSDNDAFFRGNRQSPWYVVAFGMIGASLSGVTFVSVPGMVLSIDMTYMQMCLGFFFGYLLVAFVLLPLYYRHGLTSIYSYLGVRFGNRSYKTGATFFLLSKFTGAAARLYLVCLILQQYVSDSYGVPFTVTVLVILLLIWLYTRRSGIRAIVWTDSLQTFVLFAALILMLVQTCQLLDFSVGEAVAAVWNDSHSRMFEFDDINSRNHFLKQFLSGVFIVVVMTGLDQDMMQKNLTCKNLRDAQKDMCTYGAMFVPANLLFLSLGILVCMLYGHYGMALPSGDSLLPGIIASGQMGNTVLVLFVVGVVASAFSSADSALTALTTSLCIDILEVENPKSRYSKNAQRVRKLTHLVVIIVFVLFILGFKALNDTSVIDAIYTMAGYTYGPLLGLFAFGMFTKRLPRDRYVPFVALASPLICYAIDTIVSQTTDYRFGYELLMLNATLTFFGLLALSVRRQS